VDFSDSSGTISEISVFLAGNPNSGKSSVFNLLTGLNQKVGNYPGVTVDKKTGSYRHNNIRVTVTDLPGSYSMNYRSKDEQVASEILQNPQHNIIYVADSSALKRSLYYFSQISERGNNVLLVLNMADIADEKGIEINYSQLASLLGVEIVSVNARTGEGIDELKEKTNKVFTVAQRKNEQIICGNTSERYTQISNLLQKTVKINSTKTSDRTYKIDNILTHKYFGIPLFLILLLLVFQSVFSWSQWPMNAIEWLFTEFGSLVSEIIPQGAVNDLVVNGIFAGLGGVMVFIPQIAFLFFFISILEDTGYMARVSFMMDKIFRKFGLNGRSVIPLISGTACAVPAIMSARTIGNNKERIITMLVTPLMSCSARLPVYTLIIALVIPESTKYGFRLQGVTLLALYLIGIVTALLAAMFFSKIINTKEDNYYIMEMPEYRMPRWGNIFMTIYEKIKVFVVDAGKIIIAISIVLWFLTYYGPSSQFNAIEEKYSVQLKKASGEEEIKKLQIQINAEKLEASYAGMLGHAIEPVIEPLGYNWKTGIALIASFAAREVFVGTMATIYSVGNSDNTQGIKEKMEQDINVTTGEKTYSLAAGLSLLLFYAFAMQCMSTLAVMYRETKSIKWPVIQFLYMTFLAYFAAFTVYQLVK
jgi:ferrous iron transport protein B